MGAVAPLRLIQIGQEVTRGTEVAATARLIPRPGGATWRDLTEKPEVAADWGLLDRHHSSDPAQVARQLSELDITTDLSFEQVLYALSAGVRPESAAAQGEQTIGQGDYRYLFTPTPTADPAPNAYTLEYVEREGTTNRQQITAVYGMCRRIRISAAQGAEYATLETEWFARASASQAPTADPGIPTRELVPGPKFRVATAASFAALESAPSYLDNQVVSFEWELITGITPKWRLDDDSPDFAEYQFGVRECTLRLTLDLTAEAETERTARLQASAFQWLRCVATGSAIGAGNPHRIAIDGAYELRSPVESGRDVEDQSTLDLEYTAIHDAAKAAPAAFEVTVDNTLTAIP